jgi:hypothetical protein
VTDLAVRKAQLSPEQRAKVEARLRQRAEPGSPRIPARDPDRPIPLSFAQERLWRTENIPIESPLHNAPSALRIRGPLDVSRLAEALNNIVKRHESLRFVFEDGENPTQRPLPEVAVPITLLDVPVSSETEIDRTTRQLAAEQARTPFDLMSGPLLRVVVLRFAADDHALLLTLHHVVFDGWSKGVLIGELLALYQGANVAALTELRVRFGDFAAWQRSTGAAGRADVEYWLKQLSNVSRWKFPFERPRPEHPTFEGRRRWIRLSLESSESVRQLSDRTGATCFMVLLAAWTAHCARICAARELVIATLVAGRNIPETEPLIGFFVNYLPLRIDVSGGPSFRTLIDRVRRVCLEAYEHQDAPFQTIFDRLGLTGKNWNDPLFGTSFTLHNEPMPAIRLPGFEIQLVEFDDQLVRLDLEFDLWWNGPRLEGFIVHRTSLFEEAQIYGLLEEYEALLLKLGRDPESRAVPGFTD